MKEIEIDFGKLFKSMGAWFKNHEDVLIPVTMTVFSVCLLVVLITYWPSSKEEREVVAPVIEHVGVDMVALEMEPYMYPIDNLVALLNKLYNSTDYTFTRCALFYYPENERWSGSIGFKNNGTKVEMELGKVNSWEAFQKEIDKTEILINIMRE